jgi:hypothetical protein
MRPGPFVAKVVVEGHDAVNFRPRDIQLLGYHWNSASGYVTKGCLDVVQYFEERTRSLLVLRDDAVDGGGLFGR